MSVNALIFMDFMYFYAAMNAIADPNDCFSFKRLVSNKAFFIG